MVSEGGNTSTLQHFSHRDRTVHLDNIPSRAERIIVVETGEDPVGDLFDDQLLVGFALFSAPEYPVWMAFHVFYIALGVLVLVFTEFDGEAGPYFLCVHNNGGLQYLCRFDPTILPKMGIKRQAFARLRAFLFAIGTVMELLVNLLADEGLQRFYIIEQIGRAHV